MISVSRVPELRAGTFGALPKMYIACTPAGRPVIVDEPNHRSHLQATITVVTMHFRKLLWVASAISVPGGPLAAHMQGAGPQYAATGFNDGDFRFAPGARSSLQTLWRSSSGTKQERVACIGGYRHEAITYITRVVQVSTSDSDSLNASASASLQECRPPEWLGTVHTHIVRFDGVPYVTFSGADRGVMRQWHTMWHADGVFCVLYDDRRAHCEAGDELSGDAMYAYARGNNLVE